MTLQNFALLGGSIIETSTANLTRHVEDENFADVATLEAEAYNSHAEIDYSAVLRSLLGSMTSASTIGAGLKILKYKGMYVKASIDVNQGGSKWTQYIFLRAIETPPTELEAMGRLFWRRRFLTKMPYLIRWKGSEYPEERERAPFWLTFTIDHETGVATPWNILINEEGLMTSTQKNNTMYLTQEVLNVNGDYFSAGHRLVDAIMVDRNWLWYYGEYNGYYEWRGWVESEGMTRYALTQSRWPEIRDTALYPDHPNPTSYTVEDIKLSPYDYVIELEEDGVEPEERSKIGVMSRISPAHPVYIRWLNNCGGWDEWMFSCQSKETYQLIKNDAYEIYDGGGAKSSYHKEGKRTIEASTGIVDMDFFEELRKIPFSPYIELHLLGKGNWQVQVTDFKIEKMADQPTGEIIISFELPTPQLNK